MSSIEQRLVRDISAITGGVVVTESDLKDARDSVGERIESLRRRDRRRTVIMAAAAAVVVAVVGVVAFQRLVAQDTTPPPANPAPNIPLEPMPTGAPDPDADYLTGDAPSPELLDGMWRVDDGTTLLLFDDDGHVLFDDSGTPYSDPAAIATYTLDGDLITVTVTDHADSACIGEVAAMRASHPELGAVRFVPADSSTGACNPLPSGRGALEQVLPLNNKYLSSFENSTEPGWQPLPDDLALDGVYFPEGGGHVLELDADGAYYVADDSGEPVDQGRWARQDTTLTLTSSADSSECSEGDRLVLASVEHLDSGTVIIRGTVDQNTCGGAWTPLSWIMLPHG